MDSSLYIVVRRFDEQHTVIAEFDKLTYAQAGKIQEYVNKVNARRPELDVIDADPSFDVDFKTMMVKMNPKYYVEAGFHE